MAQDLASDVLSGQGDRLGAKLCRKPERIGDASLRGLGQGRGLRRLDIKRAPGCAQPVGLPLGMADEGRPPDAVVDADQDALARRPGAGDRVFLHMAEQLVVDPLRGTAQRQLAQGRQVARREIVRDGALGGLAEIDLALFEPLDQVGWCQVDDLDIVGAVDDRIRHGLADADAGDLGDDVVQALNMLDVERGVDVDAARQQFLDIEIALGMAAAGRIGMGEFVDEDEGRAPRQDRVQVHLVERAALVVDEPARDDLETVDQAFRLAAAMGLDDADHDIDPFRPAGAAGGQHLIGLADARRRAEEDLQAPAPFALGAGEERLW